MGNPQENGWLKKTHHLDMGYPAKKKKKLNQFYKLLS